MASQPTLVDRFFDQYRDGLEQQLIKLELTIRDTLHGVVEAFKSSDGQVNVASDGSWLSSKYQNVKSSFGVYSWYDAIELVAEGSSLALNNLDTNYTIDRFVIRFYDVGFGTPAWSNPTVEVVLDSKVKVVEGWFQDFSITHLNLKYNGLDFSSSVSFDASNFQFNFQNSLNFEKTLDLVERTIKLATALDNKIPNHLSNDRLVYNFNAGELPFWDYGARVISAGPFSGNSYFEYDVSYSFELFDLNDSQVSKIEYSYTDFDVGFSTPLKILSHVAVSVGEVSYQWDILEEFGVHDKSSLEQAIGQQIKLLAKGGWSAIFDLDPVFLDISHDGKILDARYSIGDFKDELNLGLKVLLHGYGFSKDRFDTDYQIDAVEIALFSGLDPTSWYYNLASLSIDLQLVSTSGSVSEIVLAGAALDIPLLSVADIKTPTISISSDLTSLKAGQAATVTFTLSEPSTDFTSSDVIVSGGTLSNFQGSGTTYSALYVPNTNSESWTSVKVATGSFSDIAGNFNQDGSDANNVINFLLERVFTLSEGKPMSGKLPSGTIVQPNPDWFTFAYLYEDGSTAAEQTWYFPISPDGSFSVEGLGDKNGLLYAQTTAGLVKVFITPTPDPLRVITSSSGTFTGAPSKLLASDREVLQLTDGNYVGVGQLQSLTDAKVWASYRLLENGKLDVNYGSRGYASYADLIVFDAATQADNKVLVTGSLPRGAILRLNQDGSVDSTFGSSGFAYAPSWGSNKGDNSWFQGVAVQPNQSIVAVGRALNTNNWDFGVVRYLPTGQLDTSFDVDGWRTTDLGGGEDRSRAVLIQPDGKIAVAGFTNRRGDIDFAMLRLNADGSPDMSFGNGGISIVNRPSTDDYMYRAFERLGSGAFMLAGNSMTSDTTGKALAVRLDSTGNLDPTFGTNGAVVFDIPGIAEISATIWRVTELTDGRLIFAGTTDFSEAETSSYKSQSFVVRLLPSGELDQSFGTGGYTLSPFSTLQFINQTGLLDSQGRYLTGGSKTEPAEGWSVPVVSRLLPNGQIDLSFNPTPTFQPGGPAVALNHLVSIYDADASPWEIGPSASYAGTKVTIQRQGAASADDRFGALGSLQLQRTSAVGSSDAGTVNLGGLAIGSYEQAGGKLTLAFNANADQAKVDATLSSLSYKNVGASAPANLQLSVTATDAQGSSDEAIIALNLATHTLGIQVGFWRSGVPLSGVTVYTLGTGEEVQSLNAVKLRNASVDGSNNLRFDLWAEPLQSVSGVDLALTKPSSWVNGFVPTTLAGWTLETNQIAGGEYRYASADFAQTGATGTAFKLGTYTQPANALNATGGDLSLAWSLTPTTGAAGPLLQNDLAMRKASVSSGGVATVSGLYADSYQVLASRGAADVGRAITSSDALAALKIAVGLSPNAGSAPVTVAQFAAADVDGSGAVNSADALNVLKMAVGLSTAPTAEWLWFIDKQAKQTLTSPTFKWGQELQISLDTSQVVSVVGVLRGDVDGSWTPPPAG